MRSLPITPLRGQGMPDQFGRMARDLRVSLTDRCNLRCTYCMPAEGLRVAAQARAAHRRRAACGWSASCVGLGVHRGPAHRWRAVAAPQPGRRRGAASPRLTPRPQIAMTTNGIGLDRLAGPLADAGLDRVNVSLDTLDPERSLTLTRRDRLDDVLAGAQAAAAAGLRPVKVNAVADARHQRRRGADLLQWCLDHGYELRFIEQMPLDAQHAWDRERDGHRRRDPGRLRERFTLTPIPTTAGQRPGRAVPRRRRTRPTVGIIASVTRPVLRRLRPDPAHRGRAGAQLPVRPGRDRPARAAARRRDGRRRSSR